MITSGVETQQSDDSGVGGTPGSSAVVTREAVFYAAWDLLKSGNRPTIERIRMRLGNGTPRGSPNAVNVFLNEWWKQLALHFGGGAGSAVPGLPRCVAETLETLWREAVRAAAEALRAEWTDRERRLLARTKELEQRVIELTGHGQELEARAEVYREQFIAAIGGKHTVATAETHRARQADRSRVKRRK